MPEEQSGITCHRSREFKALKNVWVSERPVDSHCSRQAYFLWVYSCPPKNHPCLSERILYLLPTRWGTELQLLPSLMKKTFWEMHAINGKFLLCFQRSSSNTSSTNNRTSQQQKSCSIVITWWRMRAIFHGRCIALIGICGHIMWNVDQVMF